MRTRALAIPAALNIAMMSGCVPSAATDADVESTLDAADESTDGFPTTCDASVPGRSCYDRCLYEGAAAPEPCVVFCVPIRDGGMFGVCNTDDPDYLCRLTRGDGGEYVECLTLA